MKKLFLLVLLSLGLAACSSGGDETEEDQVVEESQEDQSQEETDQADEETDQTEEEEESKEEEGKSLEEIEETTVYVPVDWVKKALDGEVEGYEDLFLGEVSWGEEKDSPYTDTGYIPGSVHVNTDLIEEGPVWNFRSVDEVEEALLSLGIDKDTKVLLYGQNPDAVGRMALACIWMGVEDVKVVDGSVEVWQDKGYSLDEKTQDPVGKEDFGLAGPAREDLVISIDETKDLMETDDKFKLVSIRAYDEYIGETSGYSYIDKAGEPKGAYWGMDIGDYTHDDGTILSLEEMQDMWDENDLGISLDDDLAFYCGTGWRAAVPILIMYENGYDNMTLFDGGWNEWQMDDDNEVQVGDPREGDVEYTRAGDLPDDKAAK